MNGGFLVTKIKQLGDRIFEKILSEKNVDAFNGAQGRILYVLWQEDGISIRSLSIKCGLAITSLTTMLERMENQGLISRVQSETDKRKTLLFLTEKAHALKGEYDSVSDEMGSIYDEIYNKHNRSYFEALEVKAAEMAKKYDCPFVDNEMPYGRVPQGHPVIVDYFYHEEIRGTENTGKRNH